MIFKINISTTGLKQHLEEMEQDGIYVHIAQILIMSHKNEQDILFP